MKKLCCIGLALLCCISLLGCKKSLPELSPNEMDVIEIGENDKNYIYGQITGKLAPNALIVKVDSMHELIAKGETVYVITDDIDNWCEDEDIQVTFSIIQRPHDTKQYIRLIADKVEPLVVGDKPIIYLYPETETICSVKLTCEGLLTCTYPTISADGWKDFTALPDGTLIFPDGKEYYALYWEGLLETEWGFSKGYCVRGEDTAAFLEWALAKQGLTPRETNEFIVYWLPLMQENPYNVISFQTTAYTDIAVLEIDPLPDSLLRVFMAYYPSDTEVDIAPQEFEAFTREGFTVVEWGGSEVNKP